MASRAKTFLTVYAAPIAEELTLKTGSFKVVLSAGVIALSKLSAEEREKLIAEANGGVQNPPEKSLQEAIETIKKQIKDQGPAVKYIFPDKNDQALIDNFRRILGPETKKQKKKAKKA